MVRELNIPLVSKCGKRLKLLFRHKTNKDNEINVCLIINIWLQGFSVSK